MSPPRRQKRKPRRTPRPEFTGIRACKYLEDVESIDYKDVELLRKFVTERGKIMSRRSTCVTAREQRQLKRAIRRIRVMGLVP